MFDKSLQIDKAKRDSFVASIEDYNGDYEEVGKEIEDSVSYLVAFDKLPQKSKIVTRSPLASSTIGRDPKKKQYRVWEIRYCCSRECRGCIGIYVAIFFS